MEKNDIKEMLREELEREMLRVKKDRRVRALVVRPGCVPEERWVNTDGALTFWSTGIDPTNDETTETSSEKRVLKSG